MKKTKGTGAMLFSMIAVIVIICLFIVAGNGAKKEAASKEIRVGLLLYRGDDTFISTLRSYIEEKAKEYERKEGIKVTLDILDAKSNQNTQNNQVDRMLELGCDALCVNIVDRFAASVVIDKAMAADVPVIFFNREPVEEDMNRWEKLYYVGADAKDSAVFEGRILVDAYKKDSSNLDRNGDGIVSYVLLEGESNHQDSLIRTEWSIQTLKDGGVPLEKITGGIASWERSQASAMMEQWLTEYPDQIELVVANNDDMALGAIDAIDRAGILPGNDQNSGDRCYAVWNGGIKGRKTFFGTVAADKEGYANAIFQIAASLSRRLPVDESIKLENGKYFWCSQKGITQEDATETDNK